MPILVVLSLVGFIGSVTIARFAAVEPEDARRVRTREEVAAEDEARREAEEAEIAARAARRVRQADDEAPDRPGEDDARHMDWAVTARTASPHVRETVADTKICSPSVKAGRSPAG